ncbi:hypothetical protein LTR70_006836 [Exophiala xenobiotica]|uniref:Uncharacterized protein n=1 Tax=Lithohypha guttulata TaxID=1690604 RepID=A0ABR0K7K3_9EURO|nr:hypothetical protein LTR24_006445 [Lithohypha guttulata]KAK5315183.1 hypothetical protein LTR70_006836 [Exophiala xenobiotica]
MSLSRKLSQRLADHVNDIDLVSLSRISEARLTERALPNIGLVELVSAKDFAKLYDALYISMFPHQPERERSDLITDRLQEEFAGQRRDLAPYRVVGIRDHDGKAIGAAQFSVLLLPGYAVPYLQYLYVRIENRRQDMAEVLHTMILAVATADAKAHDNRSVPFTLLETKPAGYGKDDASQAVATQRAIIHTKAGAVAIMLRRESDGTTSSPHVQPGLEMGDPPLSLVWAIRRSPAMVAQAIDVVDVKHIGQDLIAAYYQSLRDEGFPEPNIRLAESIRLARPAILRYGKHTKETEDKQFVEILEQIADRDRSLKSA